MWPPMMSDEELDQTFLRHFQLRYPSLLDDRGPARDLAISLCRPYATPSIGPQLVFAVVLFEWVKQNITYVPDPISETFSEDAFVSPPTKTLEVRAGNCEGHTLLLASMLNAIGFQTRFKLVALADRTSWHIFTELNVGQTDQSAIYETVAGVYSAPASQTVVDKLLGRQRFVATRQVDSYCYASYDPIGNAWMTADTCSSRYFGDLGGLISAGYIEMIPTGGYRTLGPTAVMASTPIYLHDSPDMRVWGPSGRLK